MQMAAPGVTDLSAETRQTMSMYGIDQKETEDFGYPMLNGSKNVGSGEFDLSKSVMPTIVRRLVGISTATCPKHEKHAKAVDKPVAGLLEDLKQRGLLEDTLVWWGGEFGRTPFTQGEQWSRSQSRWLHDLVGGWWCQNRESVTVKPMISVRMR